MSLLHNVKLNYPDAREWMWNYCVYLGSYECEEDGIMYDLGVYMHMDGGMSAACVYGNEPGDYKSGELNLFKSDIHTEIYKRAKALGLNNM